MCDYDQPTLDSRNKEDFGLSGSIENVAGRTVLPA
jgi:hypothetical protein